MVVKSFNVDDEVYRKFSEYCKENGISMSKQVNTFMESQIAEEPEVREEYLKKLEKLRKGPFVKIEGSLMEHYANKERNNKNLGKKA